MKKIIYTSILIVFCLPSIAQKKINNIIDKVEELNIYGNGSSIHIGTIIINKNSSSGVYLMKSIQELQPSGEYKTIFYFGNSDGNKLSSTNLVFQFNAPISNWVSGNGASFFIVSGVKWELKDSNKTLAYSFQSMDRDSKNGFVFYMAFLSKNKITSKIYGIDGVMTTD